MSDQTLVPISDSHRTYTDGLQFSLRNFCLFIFWTRLLDYILTSALPTCTWFCGTREWHPVWSNKFIGAPIFNRFYRLDHYFNNYQTYRGTNNLIGTNAYHLVKLALCLTWKHRKFKTRPFSLHKVLYLRTHPIVNFVNSICNAPQDTQFTTRMMDKLETINQDQLL